VVMAHISGFAVIRQVSNTVSIGKHKAT